MKPLTELVVYVLSCIKSNNLVYWEKNLHADNISVLKSFRQTPYVAQPVWNLGGSEAIGGSSELVVTFLRMSLSRF